MQTDTVNLGEDLGVHSAPPEKIYEPCSESECVEVVMEAAAMGTALLPLGGGAAVKQGSRLRTARWSVVSTSRLVGDIEFSAADMVVTARAGTTLSSLQEELGKQSQFLPLDPPFPERATLGGIVAANSQGLLLGGFGLPRDRLLGFRAVLADGSVIKGGGKVVKNVAGYDINKLFAGSWGTLGLIVEVTFKSNPRPPSSRRLDFTARSAEIAARAALEVYTAHLEPIYLVVTSLALPVLSVGLMGSGESVDWQAQQVTARLEKLGLNPVAGGSAPVPIADLAEKHEGPRARLQLRPADVPDVLSELDRLPDSHGFRAQVTAGIVDVMLSESASPRDAARDLERIRPASGFLTWPRLTPRFREVITEVWGPVRPDFALMRSIKAALDPNGLFSPGRFVGGL